MFDKAILCVDDEAIILLSIKQELKSHYRDRFRFEIATNAEIALSLMDELVGQGVKVILIISDWLMPGMKGDEFLLEAHRRYPEVQSIIVTGHADPASVERVLSEANTKRVIRKPWAREELIEAVDLCLANLD